MQKKSVRAVSWDTPYNPSAFSLKRTLCRINVKPAYISPATHSVNSTGGQYSLPFGAVSITRKTIGYFVYFLNIELAV